MIEEIHLGAKNAKKPRKSKNIYNLIIKRLLRKLIDQEDQEIKKKQKEQQKRLMNEASRRCQIKSNLRQERCFSEILPEVEDMAINFTNNYIDQHPTIAEKIKQEEAKANLHTTKSNQFFKPPRGFFQSVFTLSSLSSLSPLLKSTTKKLTSSYTRFQLEELFKVLVLPEKSLEEFFSSMSQNVLKKEFKKMALLLHPDKNTVSYAKIAFQKVFAVYERCKC